MFQKIVIKTLKHFFPKSSLLLTSRDLNKFLVKENYFILEGHSGENMIIKPEKSRRMGKHWH